MRLALMKIVRQIVFVLVCAASAIANAEDATFNPIELTIPQLHQMIIKDQVSCEKVIQHFIHRIQRFDQSTKLNSVIYINPKALNKAKKLDEQFKQHRKMKSLHCVPAVVKDNIDTADMPTEAGSIAMRGALPKDDALIVQRLREQDAVIVAKTNMGEWAFSPYNTISSSHGETRNAYDLSKVPAGSSGGTASAIAANFAIIGIGSDTGNSIRGPASHLALVGLRASLDVVSLDGVVPLLSNRDVVGPLMRSVEDTALTFSVLVNDKKYTRPLDKNALKGKRIGVLRELYETETADFEVLDIMQKALQDLKTLGAELVDPFQISNFEQLSKATGFCSRFRFDLAAYLNDYGKTKPIQSLDEVVKRQLYLSRNQSAIDWAMEMQQLPREQTPPCVGIKEDPRRQQLLSAVLRSMDQHKLDAIVYPSWSNPPRDIGDDSSPHGNNSPVIAPHTGQPAITVPMGFTNAGLPLGLQILARPNQEWLLLNLAYAYEAYSKHRNPPKQFALINLSSKP